MKTLSTIAIIAWSALATSTALADEHSADDAAFFAPEQIKWSAGPKSIPPGAQAAVLEGDPSREGPFVMRLRMPDGYRIAAHTHPKVERLTVISGVFQLAMGDQLDRASARRMPAGSYGHWAAGMKHAVWIEGDTVVQLHGNGPWSIVYVNPADDPRNQQP